MNIGPRVIVNIIYIFLIDMEIQIIINQLLFVQLKDVRIKRLQEVIVRIIIINGENGETQLLNFLQYVL